MAEFQEVMRQAKRMCGSYGVRCTGCDFGGTGKRCVFRVAPTGWGNEDFESVEEKVMNWAAEHPEPRYPTWKEWWRKEFPNADHGILPCTFGIRERFGCYEQSCDDCRNKPIPADIAEKLGIKPIVGI